jgi:hypothetical protein
VRSRSRSHCRSCRGTARAARTGIVEIAKRRDSGSRSSSSNSNEVVAVGVGVAEVVGGYSELHE